MLSMEQSSVDGTYMYVGLCHVEITATYCCSMSQCIYGKDLTYQTVLLMGTKYDISGTCPPPEEPLISQTICELYETMSGHWYKLNRHYNVVSVIIRLIERFYFDHCTCKEATFPAFTYSYMNNILSFDKKL